MSRTDIGLMEPQLQLHLFGTPRIIYNGEAVTDFISNKARALLIYLAVTGRDHSRDALSELLWANTPASKRNNLKTALSNLRKLDGVSLVEERHHLVGLAPGSYWTDVEAFISLAHDGQQQQIDLLQQAVQLYRDDFLADFNTSLSYEFEEWAMRERARLRGQILDLLRRLADRYVQENSLTEAISILRQLLVFEPWEESAHRRLIELLAHNNDVGAALRQFEVCRTDLREELDVEPSPATLKLVAEIRAGSFAVVESQTLHQQKASVPVVVEKKKTTVEYPLVGRVRERQVLFERWRKLAGSHFLCIGGEAGIGKTRLAEELLIRAEEEGAAVVRARSHELQGQLAYGPITDWLRSAPLWSTVDQLDAAWRTELARLLPELLVDGLTPPEPLKEGWQRQRFFDALLHAFTAAPRPLLLVLDDLQWSDLDTLVWLQYLVEKNTQRLLVVGTVRLNEIDADHPLHRVRQQLQRHNRWTELALAALTEEATHELAVLVAKQAVDESITGSLFHDTAGNPLFVIECVRVGPMGKKSPGADFALEPQATNDNNSLPIPAKMYSVIQARLAQLSPQAFQLAQLAAAMGRAFDVTLLAAATESDEQSLLTLLDELWQRRIIREVDVTHFDFSHDRIRDVAYAEIRPIQKQLLHQKIVHALEAIYEANEDDVAGELAEQCRRAKMLEKAIRYYQQAADVSKRVYAFGATARFLEAGLAMIDEFPNGDAMSITAVNLLHQLGLVRILTHDWGSEPVGKAWNRAYKLSTNIENPFYLCRSLLDMETYHRNRGEWKKSRQYLDQALKILPSVEKLDVASHVLNGYGGSLYHMGEPLAALTYFDRAFKAQENEELYDRHEWINIRKPKASVYIRASKALALVGHLDQARRYSAQGLDIVKSYNEMEQDCSSWAFSAMLYTFLRDVTKVKELSSYLLTLSTRREFAYFQRNGTMLMAWADAHSGGHVESCAQIIRECVDGHRDCGIRMFEPYWRGLLAETLALSGEFEQSFIEVQAALAFANDCGNTYWNAQLLKQQGDCQRALFAPQHEVETCYQKAIDTARNQQAKLLELRATVSLSRIWQVQGKVAEAHQMLSTIYGWFTEGFDTADLVETKALLDELRLFGDGMWLTDSAQG